MKFTFGAFSCDVDVFRCDRDIVARFYELFQALAQTVRSLPVRPLTVPGRMQLMSPSGGPLFRLLMLINPVAQHLCQREGTER